MRLAGLRKRFTHAQVILTQPIDIIIIINHLIIIIIMVWSVSLIIDEYLCTICIRILATPTSNNKMSFIGQLHEDPEVD